MIIKDYIKNNIPISDLENVYVVADFDRTITQGNSKTSWSILASSSLVPKSYVEDRQKLYDYYRPIEVDSSIDYEVKSNLMKEWFQRHIELFIKYQINESIFEDAAKNLRIMSFRPGAKEFIDFLHENNIPLIIISAGIGNFVESFFKFNNCYYDNIFISSNKIIFKNSIAVGVEENIIHSLNKNEVSLPENIKKQVKSRENVILFGDQISDLRMVDKTKHKNVFTVGFIANDDVEYIEDMNENFDIVCNSNDSYSDIRRIIFG